MSRSILVFLLCIVSLGLALGEEAPKRSAKVTLRLVKRLPHSKDAYCQGLFFERDNEGNERLYESCGLYGRSRIQILDAKTGKILHSAKLPPKVFAEGLTVAGGEIYLLTWREGIGYVRDKQTLEEKRTFQYVTEGWGLTEDLSSTGALRPLIQSDGSAVLRWYDPLTWRKIKERVVRRQTQDGRWQSVTNLNELEWINGEIWANVFETPYIVRIDPETGNVLDVINCRNLIPKGFENETDRVFNGIAWDAATGRVFLTGKKWPVLYVMEIITPETGTSETGAAETAERPQAPPENDPQVPHENKP